MEKKVKVNQRQVRRLLAEGGTINGIATHLRIPTTVVKRIRAGKDVKFFKRNKSNRVEYQGHKLCTCCGLREVYRGNRFLCEWCYQNMGAAELQGYSVEESGPVRRDALGVPGVNDVRSWG